MTSEVVDTLIIGGGPAGLAAATYLARFRRSVTVVHSGDSRAALIPLTRNCPGFPDGIAGEELLDRLGRQAERFGVAVRRIRVRELARAAEGFIASGREEAVQARTVLLATGVADLTPDMPNPLSAVSRGLLRLCPVCDAFEVMGQTIGIVGNGDHAVKECLFLRDYTKDVLLLPTEEIAGEVRQKAVAAGIRVTERVAHIEPRGEAVHVALVGGGTARLDAIYPALGCNVRSELVARIGAACDENGYVTVDAHQRTSVPGLWAAGDVVSALNQIAVAFGQAAIAATDIHNALRDREAEVSRGR